MLQKCPKVLTIACLFVCLGGPQELQINFATPRNSVPGVGFAQPKNNFIDLLPSMLLTGSGEGKRAGKKTEIKPLSPNPRPLR